MGLMRALIAATAAYISVQAFGGSSSKSAPPKKSDPKLGPYLFVERQLGGQADAPVLLLLHDDGSRAEDALQLLDGLGTPARVLALQGDQFAKDGFAFVDVQRPDRGKAEIDAAVKLSAAAADALSRFSPSRRIVVAGVGRSGTLAALLALFGGVAVRVGLGAGGRLEPSQIPMAAGADAPAIVLTWPPDLAPTIEAAKLAASRKLSVQVVEYDGQTPPPADVLGGWLREQLVKLLP